MRKTPIFAAAVAASFAFAAPALAETWDMPTPYGATNFHTVNIQAFADEVNETTGGALEITVHPGGSLIAHPEIKNAVRSGQAQIGEFLLSRPMKRIRFPSSPIPTTRRRHCGRRRSQWSTNCSAGRA